MQRGLISNVQKFSLHDGPGIRTTVFLKGCPLRCDWCHNPENISRQPELVVFEARCVRCGQCVEACPQHQPVGANSLAAPLADDTVESLAERRPRPGSLADTDARAHCLHCGSCVAACPTGAREMSGTARTVPEVMRELLADRMFYEESHGGVTFSGGEPLVQFEFLRELLEACRQRGIHTAVDTCGYAPREHLLAIAPLTDLFLYDLKLMDDALHRQHTGVSNALILDNLQALDRVHNNLWLRVPILPGLNDAPEQLDALAAFACGLMGIQQINLLPYHKTGMPKFARLGKDYPLPDLAPPGAEAMQAAVARFTARGLNVKIGG